MEEKSVFNIIKSRTSWRSYSPENISSEHIKKIEDIIKNNNTGPFGNRINIKLISKAHPGNKALKLGTYGFIKGAKYFIVGIITNGQNNFIDFGYIFEKTILELTSLNLATCWVGGTYKRGEYAKTVKLGDDEMIPSISPVGYPSVLRSRKDKLIRLGAGSHKRKAFDKLFFDNSFSKPLNPENCGKYHKVLEMVRLAPSASNRQPWRIIKEEKLNNYHFYLARDENYQKLMKQIDLQLIDMGIAMSHFDLSSKEFALSGNWDIINPTNNTASLEYMFSWIEK